MILDHTRFDSFWRNPEKYRLAYEANIVPIQPNYYLSRGIALHRMVELHAEGKSGAEIDYLISPEVTDTRAVAVAQRMFKQWLIETNPKGPVVLESEAEFLCDIEGSPHQMAGKIDQILEINGQHWIGEIKTTGTNNGTRNKLQERWRVNKQADFYLIGARTIGYKPIGVVVRTIVESNPPRIITLQVQRTEAQLEKLKLYVHQTCEIIEFMRRTFGTDQPWPHLTDQYPCSVGGKGE